MPSPIGFSASSLFNYLDSLGPKVEWLREVVLLYKQDWELEYDIEEVLWDEGYNVQHVAFSTRLQLSEYEMCYEEYGLPRSFGKKRR